MDMRKRAIKIIAEQVGMDPSKITDASRFHEDLGADSLDTIEMVMELEEEFDIELPEEPPKVENEDSLTVGTVLNLIKERIEA